MTSWDDTIRQIKIRMGVIREPTVHDEEDWIQAGGEETFAEWWKHQTGFNAPRIRLQ